MISQHQSRENWSSGFPTRSDIKWPVQSQEKARNFGFIKRRDCTISVGKTEALISCAVTDMKTMICAFTDTVSAQWNWAFVFA